MSSNASSPNPTDFDDGPSGTPTPAGRKGQAIAVEESISRFDFGGYEDEDDSKEAVAMSKTKPSNELKLITKVHRPSSNHIKTKVSTLTSTLLATPRGTRRPRVIFSNNDLPSGIILRWTKVFVPLWMQYLGSVSRPWDLSVHLQAAQNYWDEIFPTCEQLLALKGDPIFAVLKQRTYEWRSNFMTAAVAAVQAFWDSDDTYSDPTERAAYVEWAFPEDPNQPIPGIWASVDDDFEESKEYVYKGAFQATTIISTFAQHLLLLHSVQDSMLTGVQAEGALALSATAVEHAFRRWESGHNAGKGNFSAALAEKTDLYAEDITTKLTPKSWTKLMAAAEKTLERPGQVTSAIGKHRRSARATIVDADSD
ncbi:hypothetical protein BDZ94DRAFT_1277182 [Collybia nuda]|uniref:DUF6532 domain-containing protein n=1 Tax=Collybia nuda TaxID=64659 RepID=A0A9P5XQR0_9AGAR|nr:hypothetical protein BDZ94DRAFT_1277182 [Collybia nuda]